jgi:hypothetical protein
VGQLLALYVIHARRRAAAGGEPAHRRVLVALARTGLLSAALGVAAWGTEHGLASAAGRAFEAHGWVRALVLALSIVSGGVAYFGLAWLAGAPELVAILGLKRRRARTVPVEALS